MRASLRFIMLACCLVLAAAPRQATAQCCAAGNPVNTNGAQMYGGEGVLSVAWSYMYSYSDTYYRGTQPLEKTYAESYFDYSSLGLSYGITDKLRATAEVGYFFDKSQRFVNSDYTRYATGISDATLGIDYGTYTSNDRMFEIRQTARVTIPVGEFNQAYDGVVLPIDFQPSSGNYRYSIGLVLAKRFEDSDFSLLSFNSAEFSEAIETENTYHKYGNLYNISAMGVYKINPFLQGMLQLRYEIRERALSGAIGSGSLAYLNASGGVVAYVSPQIAVNLFDSWMVSLQYNYPVYKNIYGGEQLTNRHSLAINIARALDFGGPTAAYEIPELGDVGARSAVLAVNGSCDMCRSRIEKIAQDAENVQSARWDGETQKLTVYYSDERPDIDGLERALAEAGHDAGSHTAADDVYSALPGCCHYRAE